MKEIFSGGKQDYEEKSSFKDKISSIAKFKDKLKNISEEIKNTTNEIIRLNGKIFEIDLP